MWVPTAFLQAEASFVEPVAVPAQEPGCGTLSVAWWASSLTPYILGALSQLCQPATWATSDAAVQSTTLAQMADLIDRIAAAAGATYSVPRPIADGDSVCNWTSNGAGAWVLNRV